MILPTSSKPTLNWLQYMPLQTRRVMRARSLRACCSDEAFRVLRVRSGQSITNALDRLGLAEEHAK
jgi:hypothetical protein